MFRLLTRFGQLEFNRRAAFIAVALHSILVILTATVVYVLDHFQSEAPAVLWVLWLFADFPISIGMFPLNVATARLQGELGKGIYDVSVFGLYFLLFGGLQYYVLVGYLSCFTGKQQQSDKQERP